MQIFLKFKCDRVSLPLAHKYQVQSLIYSMLSCDPGYAGYLHDDGYTIGEKHFKFFTFGNLYGKYSISGKTILFSDGFMLQLRSPHIEFINAILHTVLAKREYRLCDNPIYLYDFKLENKRIDKDEIVIKTISPITVYRTLIDGSTEYYAPTEEAFYQSVEQNVRHKAACMGMSDEFYFGIHPTGIYTEKNKMVTTYKGIYITAWSGYFQLKGSPEVLNLLYDTGLGTKNAQGFGMFELVKDMV